MEGRVESSTIKGKMTNANRNFKIELPLFSRRRFSCSKCTNVLEQNYFRTEILGLMQTQISKNALIIPTGAKGGFVLKKNPLKFLGTNLFSEPKEAGKKGAGVLRPRQSSSGQQWTQQRRLPHGCGDREQRLEPSFGLEPLLRRLLCRRQLCRQHHPPLPQAG